jgi:glycosyltransferase involved in cell wall biosynthesis
MEIHVASINIPDRDDSGLTWEEQREAQSTFYVKRAGAARALRALIGFGVCYPAWFGRGAAYAFRLAGLDLRKLALNFCYLAEAVLLAGWARRKSLTHVHVHFATPAATVALLLCRIRPISLSLTVHGPDEFYDAPGYFLRQKIAVASFICTIGTHARSQLMKLSDPGAWSKFELAPLGVDPQRFAPVSTKARSNVFEILCVGRMAPAKGQHVLLQAIAALREEGWAVLLRLVGDGPMRPSLEEDIKRLGLDGFVCFGGRGKSGCHQAVLRLGGRICAGELC